MVVVESIYNLVKPEVIACKKQPLYKSKYDGNIAPTFSSFGGAKTSAVLFTNVAGEINASIENFHGLSKQQLEVINKKAHPYIQKHADFGWSAGMHKPDPHNSLKKCSKTKKIQTLSALRKSAPELLVPSKLKCKVKAPLPNPKKKPIMNLVSKKNFITANAVDNIIRAPPVVRSQSIDYLSKPGYGNVPGYLKKVKSQINQEYGMIEKVKNERENLENNKTRQLGETEKQDLINSLKQKWSRLNSDYQCMTHITKIDSIGQIRRKESLESQLKEVENALKRLSKPVILVDMTL